MAMPASSAGPRSGAPAWQARIISVAVHDLECLLVMIGRLAAGAEVARYPAAEVHARPANRGTCRRSTSAVCGVRATRAWAG